MIQVKNGVYGQEDELTGIRVVLSDESFGEVAHDDGCVFKR